MRRFANSQRPSRAAAAAAAAVVGLDLIYKRHTISCHLLPPSPPHGHLVVVVALSTWPTFVADAATTLKMPTRKALLFSSFLAIFYFFFFAFALSVFGNTKGKPV